MGRFFGFLIAALIAAATVISTAGVSAAAFRWLASGKATLPLAISASLGLVLSVAVAWRFRQARPADRGLTRRALTLVGLWLWLSAISLLAYSIAQAIVAGTPFS